MDVIGGVRTHACLCTTDLKSVPLDRSGTMTLLKIMSYTYYKNKFTFRLYIYIIISLYNF